MSEVVWKCFFFFFCFKGKVFANHCISLCWHIQVRDYSFNTVQDIIISIGKWLVSSFLHLLLPSFFSIFSSFCLSPFPILYIFLSIINCLFSILALSLHSYLDTSILLFSLIPSFVCSFVTFHHFSLSFLVSFIFIRFPLV